MPDAFWHYVYYIILYFLEESFFFFFTLSNAKHGGKYCNRSRGKLDFKGSSGKVYGTYGLN